MADKDTGGESVPLRRPKAAAATRPAEGGRPDKSERKSGKPRKAPTRRADAAGTRGAEPVKSRATASRRPAAGTDSARGGALWLLAGVRDGLTLTDQIALGTLDRLEPASQARAQRLAAAVLRHAGRADAVLAPLLARRVRPEVTDILHLGVTEMLALGEAPHGVVNAAVALARAGGHKQAAAAGMVNAVLRRAAEASAAWDAAGPQRLPDWLRTPLVAAWGEDATRAIEAAHEAGAPLDLTAKPGIDIPLAETLPTGSFRLPAGRQVSALPGFAEGEWWVQDAAAALPARLLDARPGERVADLCAAPGGKTLQLAAAGADVTAVDLSPDRLKRVAENLARCGLAARLVNADATEWRDDQGFDAILLDAPCSATGTIRRHPELPLIRDGSALPVLRDLQARLLDHALTLLRPDGRLVYATCSLLPEEGEDQIDAALARHPGLAIETFDTVSTGVQPNWLTEAGGVRLRPDHWPERGGMDGFFMVRLRWNGPQQ